MVWASQCTFLRIEHFHNRYEILQCHAALDERDNRIQKLYSGIQTKEAEMKVSGILSTVADLHTWTWQ
jgi:hypothetical protein